MTAICKDCGIDTTPCTGKRGCRHKGRWEHYMVRDAVWAAAGMDEDGGYLCIGCLEKRLGRRLKPKDFTAARINDPNNPWHTPRLAERIGRNRKRDKQIAFKNMLIASGYGDILCRIPPRKHEQMIEFILDRYPALASVIDGGLYRS